MDADTSLVAKALIILAGGSTIAAFGMTIRIGRRQRDLLEWVRTARPAVWRLLPRGMHWLPEAAMVARLRRDLSGDNDFAQRDMAAQRGRPFMLAALLAGMASIGIVAAGVAFGVWTI